MSEYIVASAEPVAYSVDDTQLVQVVAPATLSAGYTFLATANGRTVSVVVPEGGVKEGQNFMVPVIMPSAPTLAAAGEATPFFKASNTDYSTSPRGYWKDGLWDCFTFGPCHPSLWNAVCCPQLLMAQVLTRMNMTWLGEPTSNSSKTFRRVLYFMITYWVVGSLLAPPLPDVEFEGDDMNPEIITHLAQVPALQNMLYHLVNMAFGLYSLIVMVKLRRAVRERYSIPTQTCCDDVLEDCCCFIFCGCCTVAQLARHTADYQERRALYCSSTGLPPSSSTVVMVV